MESIHRRHSGTPLLPGRAAPSFASRTWPERWWDTVQWRTSTLHSERILRISGCAYRAGELWVGTGRGAVGVLRGLVGTCGGACGRGNPQSSARRRPPPPSVVSICATAGRSAQHAQLLELHTCTAVLVCACSERCELFLADLEK
jgi:hypothetical protein